MPSSLPVMPGNSHGLPAGQCWRTWSCWARIAAAALALSGIELLGADLGGLEAQAGPAGAVVEHRVERQAAGVAAAQPGLDQDHDEVARGGEREPVQGGGGFELGHHELGDEPGHLVVVGRELFDVDDGAVGQPGQPAVRWQASENTRSMLSVQRPGGSRVALGQQPRQVVLQDRPGDAGLAGDAGVALGQERREPGQGQRPGGDGRERAPGGQAEPGPPLDRLAQPVLGDGVEPGRAAARGGRGRRGGRRSSGRRRTRRRSAAWS